MFTFGQTPSIPVFEDGELRIPRRNLATFNKNFSAGQPRAELRYMYRLHPYNIIYNTSYNTTYEYSYKTLFDKGIEYRNPLDNIRQPQGQVLSYIEEIISRSQPRENGLIIPKGTYFYTSLEAAVLNQYNNLLVDHFSIDENGKILPNSNIKELSSRLWIITRILISSMPEGTYFADPNPPDSPEATLHVVDQIANQAVIIPPEAIQVSLGRDFVNAVDLNAKVLKAMVDRRDISPLIGRILPDSRPSTWWKVLMGLRWPRLRRLWVRVAGFR